MLRKLEAGGIERDVTKFAVGLDRKRFVPHVAVYEDGGLRWDEVKRAGVPVLDLRISTFRSPAIAISALRFCRYILSNRIRVVHAWDPSAIFAAPLARFMRVPLVLSSALGHRDLFDQRTRKQISSADRLVDTVVVNCEAMRRHLIADYAVSAERIALCYNGVETAEFFPEPGPKPDPVSDASLVIGSACLLRPEKRLDMLIEAFAPLSPRYPGLKLLIVGSGPELRKLQARAAQLGIQSHCCFVPAVPAVARYLRAMDIFVSCSSSEAFSNAILEAMACGCCPVGSRVGGTPELIADGERGLLFESGDVNGLSQRLATLLDNGELRARLAGNAARFAAHDLNMQRALDRMSEIYERGLAAKGALG